MVGALPFFRGPMEKRAAQLARACLLAGAIVCVICAPVFGRRYTIWAWLLAVALALALPALLEVKVLRSSMALIEVLWNADDVRMVRETA